MASNTLKSKKRTNKYKSSSNSKNPKKETSESKQYSIAILKGFLVGTAALFIILSICSIIMVKSDYSEKSIPIMAISAAVIAAFVGGFWSAKCIKKKGLITGIITNIPLSIVLVILVMIANGGSAGTLVATAILLMLILGGVGGIVGVNSKSKKPL